MAVAGLLFNLGKVYVANAARAYAAIQATNGGQLANFNLAQLMADKTGPTVELTNLIQLERELKELGPDLYNKFKSKARKIGTPARNEVRDEFSRIGPNGPLGMPRRPGRIYDGFNTVGRLAWDKSYYSINSNSGVDVHYKNRNASRDLYKLKTGQDGAISVLRVRVRKPALVLADMAGRGKGKAMFNRGKMQTNPYQINLFGRGVVTRTHRINQDNSRNFVLKLNEKKSQASRYAYPALEKHRPEYVRNVDSLLNETIAMLNKTLEK